MRQRPRLVVPNIGDLLSAGPQPLRRASAPENQVVETFLMIVAILFALGAAGALNEERSNLLSGRPMGNGFLIAIVSGAIAFAAGYASTLVK